jgi:hypothetical protein
MRACFLICKLPVLEKSISTTSIFQPRWAVMWQEREHRWRSTQSIYAQSHLSLPGNKDISATTDWVNSGLCRYIIVAFDLLTRFFLYERMWVMNCTKYNRRQLRFACNILQWNERRNIVNICNLSRNFQIEVRHVVLSILYCLIPARTIRVLAIKLEIRFFINLLWCSVTNFIQIKIATTFTHIIWFMVMDITEHWAPTFIFVCNLSSTHTRCALTR